MWQIKGRAILIFLFIQLICIAFMVFLPFFFWRYLSDSFLPSLFCFPIAIAAYFTCLLVFYRILLYYYPITGGIKRVGMKNQTGYEVYCMLMLFILPLIVTEFLPIPLLRVLYSVLGAKIGRGSFGGAILYDPALTEIGSNTVFSAKAVLCPHEGHADTGFFQKIKIGNKVTLGQGCFLSPGVIIEDQAFIGINVVLGKFVKVKSGAILLPNAYVEAGTVVGSSETWGGNPARKIQNS